MTKAMVEMGITEEQFRTAWEENNHNATWASDQLQIGNAEALRIAREFGLEVKLPGRPGIPESSREFMAGWYKRGLTTNDIVDVLASGPYDEDLPPMSEAGVRRVLRRKGAVMRRKGPNNT